MLRKKSCSLAEAQWKRALVTPNVTLGRVVENLDHSALRLALVVNDTNELVGTISDGDVRRGLLRGLTMDSPIETLIQRNPLVVPKSMRRDLVRELMTVNKIQQVPVIDENRKIQGLHLWDEINQRRVLENILLVMVGGKGTRLRPRTENCPKPLLPVGGKPMLEHIVERAKQEGFVNYIFALGYLGNMIEEYFGDGSSWGVKIDYLREKSPLGTAGAIGLFEKRPEQPILVTNGDVLTDVRYSEMLEFHVRHGAAATMAVRVHEWQHPFGVVKTQGLEITGFEEKPVARTHINAGVYVLDPIAIDELRSNEKCDMPDLFSRLQTKGLRTVAYPMHEPWLDIGRPVDYEEAQQKNPQTSQKGNTNAG